ncbi:hypothetical protein MIND_01346500 [Mycena indigotica]|uniref:DUF6534 domain-containing protein n=1 Tax=Mycena indigotica TaxID=2126181 RepID=A0A8H6RYM2_9AGAR|nr:uncharacterized protein MIND_01346500 [Mycena indigotica]KAF7289729.1 hypothetical protein MIND_01346500 [Mycena indigotica]
MSGPPPHLPSFNASSTIGALLVGTLFSVANDLLQVCIRCSLIKQQFVLFGVTTVQLYLYYGRFPDDKLGLKLLVGVVWLLEATHVACIGQVNYFYAVTNYGNPSSLFGRAPAALAVSVALGALITAIVQGFFAFRIWTLAPNVFFKLVPLVLWLSAFVYLVAAIADTVFAIEAVSIPAFIEQYGWLLLAPWVLNLFNDNVITLSLVVLLLMNRNRGLQKTTALVDKLVAWTIGINGDDYEYIQLLECGLCGWLCYQREPNNFIWVGIQVVKARLFANSLLASLNSRHTLRDLNSRDLHSVRGSTTGAHFQVSRPISTNRAGISSNYPASTHGQPLDIAMTKVTLQESDPDDVERAEYEHKR